MTAAALISMFFFTYTFLCEEVYGWTGEITQCVVEWIHKSYRLLDVLALYSVPHEMWEDGLIVFLPLTLVDLSTISGQFLVNVARYHLELQAIVHSY